MLSKHAKDLTGYRSGWLEVINYIEGSGGKGKHTRWNCYCHRCGNYTEVEGGHLTSTWRPILSCGCLRDDAVTTTLEDLTGQIFGLLLVESLAKRGSKGHHAKWNCKCICGNHTIADSSDLKKGKRISCGCITMSKGEIAVWNVLKAYNIINTFQYGLYDNPTKAGGIPRIDFALYDKNENLKGFIEFQGPQHYKDMGIWGKISREETDPLKKEYCKNINIPLFEIKYDQNPTQETIKILETLMLIPCQASKEEGVSTIP